MCGAASSNFSLAAEGWGTFLVNIRVTTRNNHDLNFQHQLVFTQQRTAPAVQLTAENSSKELEPNWWEWAIRIKGTPAALDRIRCVEYTLHPSFPNPVRTICTRQNNFELKATGWGTFAIPIKVLFKDQTLLQLTHELRFTR